MKLAPTKQPNLRFFNIYKIKINYFLMLLFYSWIEFTYMCHTNQVTLPLFDDFPPLMLLLYSRIIWQRWFYCLLCYSHVHPPSTFRFIYNSRTFSLFCCRMSAITFSFLLFLLTDTFLFSFDGIPLPPRSWYPFCEFFSPTPGIEPFLTRTAPFLPNVPRDLRFSVPDSW